MGVDRHRGRPGISILTFWTHYSDRITETEAKAAQALDSLAEVKRVADVAIGEAKREAKEATDKADALGAKLYQVGIWTRDEFARKSSFEAIVSRLERGFVELKQDIGTRLDRTTDRIETIKAGAHA